MAFFLFIGALIFLVYSNNNSRNLSFVDIYILFCLYFDATFSFIGGQYVGYLYFQNAIIFLYSVYYFFIKVTHGGLLYRRLLGITLLFLTSMIILPLLQGISLNQAIRTMSMNYSSLIILPISYHYYATRGSIINLFRIAYIFIISWVLIVVIYSIFKIDVTLSSEHLGSNTFGAGILYYGNMAARGAITYIAFLILLIPFIVKNVKERKMILVYMALAILILAVLLALKRFAFVAVGLGFLNYLIKSSISKRQKFGIIAAAISVLSLVLLSSGLENIIEQRYEARGGVNKYSEDAVTTDIRIYEPLYVLENLINKPIEHIFFGSDSEGTISVSSNLHYSKEREVHNQYASFMLEYGILGMLLYLNIYWVLYRRTRQLKIGLDKMNIPVEDYWIVFQNFVIIFVIEGMIGGHVHITLRGLIMVFGGGIAGYFSKLINQRKATNLLLKQDN